MVQDYKPQDLSELLEVRNLVERSIENSAFFNWPENVFKQELLLSTIWVSRDPQSNILNGFLLFREEWDRLEIMVLGTSPAFKKSGVMIEILLKLQVFAAQQGKAVGLEVHAGNEAARRLYLKMGFKIMHSRKNYYKDGASAELYLWKSQA